MAHVASALKSQLLKGMLPQPGKQTYASDAKAQNSFDSLLDSNTPPAPEPRQPRAAEDKAPRTERSERSERPKTAARPDRPVDAAEPAPKAEASEETTDTKPAETAVTEKPAAEGETKTAEATEQPVEAEAADATAVAVAAIVNPTITPAKTEAVTEVKAEVAPVAATTTTATQAAPDTAAEVTADAEAAPAAMAALAGEVQKKPDDKPAATAKAEAKTEAKAPGALTENATPQAATAEPHKDSEAHASAQETANTHRGVATDKPASPATPATDTSTTAAPKADLIPPPTLNVAVPAHAVQATTAVAAANITAEASRPDAAVPVAGVAFEITSKITSGKNQFDIRLDPAELGRIHVRLDVDRDGNVVTHMMADRPDTLDMLRKDTAGLERALQDAGLKTSDNSLQFSLRDQSTNQHQSNENGRSNTAHLVVEDEKPVADTIQRNYAAYRSQAGGLDIRV
ncbi:MAG: flagellar hook-length control protein FliK [Pseudolabrys sp.]|nr:flagellar hook-length control protein FliK [Pseudolabrys sp.]